MECRKESPRSGRFLGNKPMPGEDTAPAARRGAGPCRPGPPDPALKREMQLKLFILPVKNLSAAEAEMNAFLRSRRVLAVNREFVGDDC